MNTNPREKKLLPFLAGCLVLAVAAGVTVFLVLARPQPPEPGEPSVQPETPAVRLTGLRTERFQFSQRDAPRVEYDLPYRQPGLSLTNMVLQDVQLLWRQAVPVRAPSIRNDAIESAERINELMLRRYQDEWRRANGQ